MNENLAEFVGAMIGDGCLTIARRQGKKDQELALLTGHIRNDFEYYTRIIRPIIRENFGVEGYLKRRVKDNCIELIMSKSIHQFLRGLDFPIGVKYDNLQIPKSIFGDKRLAKACLRGIFDTDGSIYRRYSKPYNKQKKHTITL